VSVSPIHFACRAPAGEDALLVTVNGGIAADRAEILGAAAEEALEQPDGRRVVVDLTAVTSFDHHSIDALAQINARRGPATP
jgi:anti-anti-sigma regulatory factor